MTCSVRYHSKDWDVLVETGWITVSVSNGTAIMLKVR